MIGNPLLLGGGDYEISRSVRLRSSASASFSRTPASATNRRSWTWSGWLKRGAISGNYGIFSAKQVKDDITGLYIGSTDKLTFIDRPSGVTNVLLQTEMVLRDPSAWYHIVLQADTPNATSSDRVKIFVNGVRVTAFSLSTLPSQNYEIAYINNTQDHRIGAFQDNTAQNLDGYLTEINFIDGQALTPSSFGESNSITGVWQPKKYTGTYGTNGFYLNFSDNSNNTAATIGKDYSGNGNNWTPNNISVTSGATYDSMLDVPTPWADGGNGRGNYCTANPLLTSNNITFSNANLSLDVGATGGVYRNAGGTFAQSTGKWYWEFAFGNTAANPLGGVGDVTQSRATWESDTTGNANFWYVNAINGNKVNAGSTSYGSSFLTTDICMVALDMDNGRIWWGKNGTWFASGDPAAGTNAAFTNLTGKTLAPAFFGGSGSSGGNSYTLNFGQRPFAYTPPSGFKALNTLNLPEPTIKKGNQYFDATTYSGASTSQNVVNAGGFQPDLVWIKSRTGTNSHILQDALRGAGKTLFSNSTSAESGNAGDLIGAFNSNGFSVNDTYLGGGGGGGTNGVGGTYVGWQWKEGATQGFDIVTWAGNSTSGRTIAHSLGVAPSMIITKSRTNTSSWVVGIGNISGFSVNDYLSLNSTNGKLSSSTFYQAYGSSTFTVGVSAADEMNKTGNNYVSYLFAEVAGFSRFGSYTGNGSTDGPFVFCGFAPAFIMLKRTDSTGNWTMYDRARSTRNPDTKVLYPNLSNAEDASTDHFDWLSNGFKMKSTNQNTNGGTFIFMAMAEHPFKLSLAR